ncbi:hypothetical protein C7M61_001516 [Candidozyma pseudohaemuli]|uniref:Increased recombination centers protein 6 n=1 Tax=Candidozyma pseudohaemuli TaxID=418784 RepID=A0A2P7YUS8_9ASCO|nr:hypothetical protein C7M61_001516 [[Candida] pseudohaemulonii]PSK39711.1 hypothetical protein C7M61_001516 [[Candida] pseudohaemulonii]
MIPNNVLILGPPESGKIRLAQHITKDLDTSTISKKSHSGLIYNHTLKTKYFSTDLNLLIEEFPEERPVEAEKFLDSLREWKSAFESKEYEELRDALDGIIFTINPDQTSKRDWKEIMHCYYEIKNSIDEGSFSTVIASTTQSTECLEELEDECIQYGIEFIYEGETGTNEFKEKLGKERVQEILESHEWSHISPSEPQEYFKHKEDKVDSMTRGLLEPENESIALDQLVEKLRLERSKATDMKPEEKENYVKLVIEELIDYI